MASVEIKWGIAGFTLNLLGQGGWDVSYFDVEMGRVYTTNAEANVAVHSTYELGFVFGALASAGISNKRKGRYRGQVLLSSPEGDYKKFRRCVEESFGMISLGEHVHSGNHYRIVVYNKPIVTMFENEFELDKGDVCVPNSLLVGNKAYLRGILDGIHSFRGHVTRGLRKPHARLMKLRELLLDAGIGG